MRKYIIKTRQAKDATWIATLGKKKNKVIGYGVTEIKAVTSAFEVRNYFKDLFERFGRKEFVRVVSTFQKKDYIITREELVMKLEQNKRKNNDTASKRRQADSRRNQSKPRESTQGY